MSDALYKKSIIIDVGDFNCTFDPMVQYASLDAEKQEEATEQTSNYSTVTSVTPSVFRENKKQGAANIDGAFYKNPGESIQQAFVEHINSETGQVFTNKELELPPLEEFPKEQQQELTRFRRHMNLNKIRVPNFGLEGAVQTLNEAIGDSKILAIKEASNLLNERALAIEFSLESNNSEYFQNLGYKTETFNDHISGESYGVLYLPGNKDIFLKKDNFINQGNDLVQSFKTQIILDKTQRQLINLVEAVQKLRGYKIVDDTKYGQIFQIVEKIKLTQFTDLDAIKIAAKNFITLALQRNVWDFETTSGKTIRDLLNTDDYAQLKRCVFSEKPSKLDLVTYPDLVNFTDVPGNTTNAKYKFFSSSNKGTMYGLYKEHLSRKDIAIEPYAPKNSI